jgi:GNAT superfamily N-acetyltransferase
MAARRPLLEGAMTSSNLTIRPARDDDREALIEMFQGLNVYEEPFVRNRRIDRAGGEDSLVYAEKKVADSGGHKLVAEVDGRVVGHLFLTWERHGACVRNEVKDYGYVSELFVREEHRGRGIGRALLFEAERLTRERGFDHMLLGVLTGNTVAERAYERFGFRPYATDLIKPIEPRTPSPARSAGEGRGGGRA